MERQLVHAVSLISVRLFKATWWAGWSKRRPLDDHALSTGVQVVSVQTFHSYVVIVDVVKNNRKKRPPSLSLAAFLGRER